MLCTSDAAWAHTPEAQWQQALHMPFAHELVACAPHPLAHSLVLLVTPASSPLPAISLSLSFLGRAQSQAMTTPREPLTRRVWPTLSEVLSCSFLSSITCAPVCV